MNGIVLVDKPLGYTSHDVVQLLRKLVRPAKVGHTGTLDPAASGLLILAIGSATRAIEFLDDSRKTYLMTVRLGEETDTWDGEGQVVSKAATSHLRLETIQQSLLRYLGVVQQTPPHFSALKKNGTPLYKFARKGIFFNVQPREVEIYCLDIISWNNPMLSLRMSCSRGAYARSVAHDIGKDLGVGGRIESLRRTHCGRYDVHNSVAGEQLKTLGKTILAEKIITLQEALGHIPTLTLTQPEIDRLMNGAVVVRELDSMIGFHVRNGRPAPFFKVLSPMHDYLIITDVKLLDGKVAISPKKVLKISL